MNNYPHANREIGCGPASKLDWVERPGDATSISGESTLTASIHWSWPTA